MPSGTRKRQNGLSHEGRKKVRPRAAQSWPSVVTKVERWLARTRGQSPGGGPSPKLKSLGATEQQHFKRWDPFKTTGRARPVKRELLRSHPPNQKLTGLWATHQHATPIGPVEPPLPGHTLPRRLSRHSIPTQGVAWLSASRNRPPRKWTVWQVGAGALVSFYPVAKLSWR